MVVKEFLLPPNAPPPVKRLLIRAIYYKLSHHQEPGMKNYISFICVLLILSVTGINGDAASKPNTAKKAGPISRIAVIKSIYDNVDVALDNYHIPYDLLEFRELERPDVIDRYRALFIPSGAETPVEDNLVIIANNFRFKSVALKPEFYEVDKDKVARTIHDFVKAGGSAYFSGYSFDNLQRAFGIFEFFDNFPYMGMPARVEAELKSDLARFCMKDMMALYLNHPGWIAISSADDSEVLARCSFETPRGNRSGPVSILARRGNGEILYTSYDGTVFSPFRRFNIYRIAGAHLLKRLESEAGKYRQRITGRIVDSLHDNEYAGMHRIDLEKGNNTIYFHSERDFFQIDILDKDLSLIESRDLFLRDQVIPVRSKSKDYCFIKLYPSTAARFSMYSLVSASGVRVFPYFYHILAGLIAAIVIGASITLYRLFFIKGYSGSLIRR
jgi:hypothetical protein